MTTSGTNRNAAIFPRGRSPDDCMKDTMNPDAAVRMTHRVPASEIAAFIQPDAIDALLAPWLPDPGERAMVVRCLLEVGPAHHRGSNYVLLRLMGLLLTRISPAAKPAPATSYAPVPLRIPPSVETTDGEMKYPFGVPTDVLERLAPKGSRSWVAMIDCLTDGPPQHSLANAAMLCMLDALLRENDPSAGPNR